MVDQEKRVAPGWLRNHQFKGSLCRGPTAVSMAVSSAHRPSSQIARGEQAAPASTRYIAFACSLIVGGCLMALGRGSSDYSWLTWIALIPLFFSIELFRPSGACLSGLLWGVSFFAFSQVIVGSDVPGTWTSLALLSVVPAFYALVAAFVTQRVGFSPLVLAFGWTGVELVLALLGLRNGLLAAPLVSGALISPLGHVLGFVLVAFLVALVNALVVGFFERIRLKIPGRYFVVGSSLRETLLVSQTLTPTAGLTHFSLTPRAPPIKSVARVAKVL